MYNVSLNLATPPPLLTTSPSGWKSGAIPELFSTCPQGEWGNHDIGTCPSFAAGADTSSCKQKVTYKESVDTPGQYLPGCNPVVTTDPAPKMEVAQLGVCTAECRKAGSGKASSASDDHHGSSSQAPKAEIPAYVPAASSVPAAVAPAYEAPAAAAGDDTVWITEVITVTGAAPAKTPAAYAPAAPAGYKRHDHMAKHRQHARSL
jgi:hypothetical protein